VSKVEEKYRLRTKNVGKEKMEVTVRAEKRSKNVITAKIF
jgi:hypothetical protein